MTTLGIVSNVRFSAANARNNGASPSTIATGGLLPAPLGDWNIEADWDDVDLQKCFLEATFNPSASDSSPSPQPGNSISKDSPDNINCTSAKSGKVGSGALLRQVKATPRSEPTPGGLIATMCTIGKRGFNSEDRPKKKRTTQPAYEKERELLLLLRLLCSCPDCS
jgi:hypothetical protein